MKKSTTVLLLVLSGYLNGCATIGRLLEFPESPQVYGGTRAVFNANSVEVLFNPFYKKDPFYGGEWEGLGDAGMATPFILCIFAVPFVSVLAADTVLLPLTIPTEIIHQPTKEGRDSPDDELCHVAEGGWAFMVRRARVLREPRARRPRRLAAPEVAPAFNALPVVAF